MPDVFILSETWCDGLCPAIIPGYKGYHSVRIGRSGGVSVYVKHQITSSKIDERSFTDQSIEICTVKISFNAKNLIICGIYRPHSGTVDSFTNALENIIENNTFANAQCIIAGDFNANLRSNDGDVDGLVQMMQSHHIIICKRSPISLVLKQLGQHPHSLITFGSTRFVVTAVV